MRYHESIFEIKLREIDREYNRLQNHLRLCEEKDPDRVRCEMVKMNDETCETMISLQRMVENSPSPFAASLAQTHREYCNAQQKAISAISEKFSDPQERADVSALYAEYAMDFAMLSIKQAMFAALNAISFELEAENNEEDV